MEIYILKLRKFFKSYFTVFPLFLAELLLLNFMHLEVGFHTYYIYIITNKAKYVFYTGVTNDLRSRLLQHKNNIVSKNTALLQNIMWNFYSITKNSSGFRKRLQEKKK